jgi:serine/threonine-protein kinase
MQEEISAAIAGVLRLKLTPVARKNSTKAPPSIEAYNGYLQARFLVHQQTRESLNAAVEQYRRVTQLFPGYAAPFAGLTVAYGFLSLFGIVSGREVLPEMRRNLDVALRLDPESPDVCAVMAGVSAHFDYQWATSEEYFQRVFAAQPGHADAHTWHGMALAAQGRLAEAKVELLQAVQVNPLSAADCTRMGYLHYFEGDDELAISQFDRAFSLIPDFPEGRLFLAELLLRRRDYRAAAEILSRNMERQPSAAHLGLLAGVFSRWGRTEEGRAALHRLDALGQDQYVTPLAYVFAYLGMGDLEQAAEAVDRGITERTPFLVFLNEDPIYEPLKRHPRFPSLVRRLNLLPKRSVRR